MAGAGRERLAHLLEKKQMLLKSKHFGCKTKEASWMGDLGPSTASVPATLLPGEDNEPQQEKWQHHALAANPKMPNNLTNSRLPDAKPEKNSVPA